MRQVDSIRYQPPRNQVFNCSWCSEPVQSTSYSAPYGPRMEAEKLCFICVHWDIESNRTDDYRRIIINGYCYGVGEKEPSRNSKGRIQGEMWGFGGRRFDIELFTGQRFTTHNLWGGGQIPERFRDKMPDNARFLNGASKAQVGDTTCWDSSNDQAEPYPTFNSVMGKVG